MLLVLRLLLGFILTFGLPWLPPCVGWSLGRLLWSRSCCLCWVGPGGAVVLVRFLKFFRVLLVGVYFIILFSIFRISNLTLLCWLGCECGVAVVVGV